MADLRNPVTGTVQGSDSRVVPTIKGKASTDKMAPLPKTEEETDREEYEKQYGKVGIGNQKAFADWRAKKRGKLSNLAPKK